MNRFSEKFLLLLVSAMVIAFIADGCAPSMEERYKERLNNFMAILPTEIRIDFENKKYDLVVQKVDSLLAIDTAFTVRWEKIKSAEAYQSR